MSNNNQNSEVIKAKIIAIGGCGANILVDFLKHRQLQDISYLLVTTKTGNNTLRFFNPSQTMLLDDKSSESGFELNPIQAERAALLAEQDIKKQLVDTKLLFILAGMGGATGTGASHIFAKVAKTLKSLTIAIAIQPFDFEDSKRLSRASEGIKKLQENSDALIVVSNSKIAELYNGISISDSFTKANQIIFDIIQTIIDLISKQAFVEIDFSILRKAIRNHKKLFINSGLGFGKQNGQRAKRAAQQALIDSVIDFDFKLTKQVIIIISAKNSYSEEKREIINTIVQFLESKGAHNFEYSCGIYLAPELDENIKVGLIISGDESHLTLTSQINHKFQEEPRTFNKHSNNLEFEDDQDAQASQGGDDLSNPFGADF
ncbi:cell division protein FtsZ [Mesomycoplasma hyorhinis]|uniref:cell division protein FtsZ n=1 Tax=Mesomycoplasma hyorhinis TaxID=2100 RepID=UPI001C05AA28|nr:cell division protein FtsZ [Mesomycoplasma hyorhinis]